MAKSNFIVRGGADFSNLYKGFNTAQKRMTAFQAGMQGIFKKIGLALGGIAIGKLVKDSTEMAMSVESAFDNISRNMGEAAGAFSNWANTQSQALGMAKADVYKYGSTFSNLLNSFTSGAKETADQTQELMKAAAIIASKTGRTYEDTANRIRSGLLGSTEAIEDLGVYVNVSMLESTQAFKKFANGKSWSQLSYQTQQQIRLAAILEQTYARYGDALADTTQTRQAQFIASLKNIQLSLGQAFLPIYNAILPALTALANAIGRVINIFAQFMTALFGAPKQIQAQANAMENLGTATDNAGKSAKKAAKAAKGALAGFDEINKLNKANAAAGGGGGAGGGAAIPTTDTSGTVGAITAVSEKVKEMATEIKKYLEPAIASLGRLKEAFAPLGQNIANGLKWILDNVLIPLGTWAVTEVVPRFIDLLANVFRVLNEVIEALKPLWDWLWENLFLPVAQWTGGVILDILDGINKGLTAIGDWISENQKTVETLAIIVGSFAAAWGLVNAAITIWNVIAGIATAVTTGFGAAIAFLMSPIGIAIAIIGALIAVGILLWKNWDAVKAWIINAWEKIKTAAVNVWTAIKNFFVNTWNSIKTSVQNVWNGIKTWISNLWNGIKNTALNVFNNIKNGIVNAFNAVRTTISNIWSGIWGTIKGFINKIIDGINGMISGLNKLQFKAPDWVPGIGGKSFGINIPKIPRLAQGGIISSPTIAMIGEAGAEAVMPLERNTGWIDVLAGKLASAMQGAQLAGVGGDIYVYIGNEQVDAYIYRSQDRRNIRSNGR